MSTAVKSIGIAEGASLSEIRAQNAQFAEEVGKLHEKLQLAYAGMSQFAGASQEIGTTSVRAGVDIEGLTASMGKIAGRANAMLEVAGTVAAVGQAFHSSSAQAENLRTRLDLATGGKGAQEMAYVTALADRLGLQLGATGQAYADFATKARGTSLEGAQVQTIFSGIATASAAMGLSSEQGSASLSAVLDLMGKGAINASDFSEKLGHIPNAALVGAQALGVTQERFTQMLGAGEVVAQDFLPRFAQALQSSLGDGVDQAASRLDAGTNRMGSAWDKLKTAIGDSGISRVISVGMNAAANDMNSFSESMTRARDNGSGFLGQISSGLGVLAGRAVGLNYLSMGFQSNAEKAATLARELPRARAELEALQAKGAATSRNVWVRSAHGDAQRLVEKLQQAQKELMAVQGQRSAGGGRGFINPSLVGSGSTESKGTEKPTQKKETPASRSVSYVVPRAPVQAQQDSEKLQRDREREQEEKKRAQELAQLLKDQQSKAQIAEKNLELAQQETEAIGLTGEALGRLRQKQIEKTVADIEDKATKEEGIRCSKEMAEAVGKEANATRDLALAKDYNESARMVSDYAKSVKESSEALQFEQSLAAVSQRDRQIALEQYKVEIELKKKLDDIAAKNPEGSKEAQSLKEKAVQAASQAKANVAERARMVETQKAVDQVDEMFRKGFADTLANGTDAWRTFTKGLGDSFKASVVDQLYKAFVQPLVLPVIADVQGMIGSISANYGFAKGAGERAASGGTNGLSSFSDWSTWGSKGSAWLLDKGNSFIADGWQSTGSSLVSLGNTVKGVDSWLKEIPGFDGGIGSAAGYLGSIYSLTQGQYGSAAGSAIGTYILPGIGTMIGSVIGGALDTAFGSRGANHSGAAASASGLTNDTAALQVFGRASGDWYDDVTRRHNADLEKKLKDTVGTLSGVYQQLVSHAGTTARQIDVLGAYAVNGRYGDEDSYGYGQIRDKQTGAVLASFTDRALGTDPEKAWAAYVGKMGALVVEQLKAADIPGWMRNTLAALGESPSVDKLAAAIVQINTAQAAMTQFGLAMPQFAAQADAARTALIDASGGSDVLTHRLGSFYNNFFSESERAAVATSQLSDELGKLGYAMPASRDEYRAWVTAAIEVGEAGVASAAGLLKLESAVAGLLPVTKDAATEAAKAQRSAADIAGKEQDLQIRLLRAQGYELAAVSLERQHELSALEEYGTKAVGIQAQIWALQDHALERSERSLGLQKRQEARAAADGIVKAQREAFQGLGQTLAKEAQRADGGMIGSLAVSSKEAESAMQFKEMLDGAAASLQELEKLGLADELAGYMDEIGKLVQSTKQMLADQVAASRLLAGNAEGAVAALISASTLNYAQFTHGDGREAFNSAAFNAALAKELASMAGGLIADASVNALQLQNVAGVLSTLNGVVEGAREYVAREMGSSVALSFGETVSSRLVQALSSSIDTLVSREMLQYRPGAPGLANISNAGQAYAQAAARDYVDGRLVVGSDAIAYAKSVGRLNGELRVGAVSAEQYADAIRWLDGLYGASGEGFGVLSAQMASAGSAALDLASAGFEGLDHYLAAITASADALDAKAREAATPLGQIADGIGRMQSAATAFSASADAVLTGLQGAVGDYASAAEQAIVDARDVVAGSAAWYGFYDASARYATQSAQAQHELNWQRDTEGSQLRKGWLAADAARITAQVMTTASAAEFAKQIKQSDAFSAAHATDIRDASQLLDGVRANDAAAFEGAYARLTAALNKGTLNEAQYIELMNLGLRTLSGEQADLDKRSSELANAFTRLGEAARSTADALLLSETDSTLTGEQRLSEAQRQYAEILDKARAGDANAVSGLGSASKALLDAARGISSEAEYRRLFAETIRDLQVMEVAAAAVVKPGDIGESGPTTPVLRVPALSVGTNYLPNDMLAFVHAGERIIPAADNRQLLQALQTGGSPDVVALLREIMERLESLEASNLAGLQAVQLAAIKSTEALQQIVADGIPSYSESQQ